MLLCPDAASFAASLCEPLRNAVHVGGDGGFHIVLQASRVRLVSGLCYRDTAVRA